jgi:hypothetical protein
VQSCPKENYTNFHSAQSIFISESALFYKESITPEGVV